MGMKKKKVSVIAKGRMAKSMVLRGSKRKTSGGLTADKLRKNKNGRIVSKNKKAFKGSKIEKWAQACQAARKQLNLKGFVPFGGKTAAGKALYAKAKAIYNA